MIHLGRQFWVVAHRWAGLTIATVLIVAGATGALLPFEEALTLLSRPDRAWSAPPVPGAVPLDGVALAERVEAALGASLLYVPLEVPSDHVQRLSVSAAADGSPVSYDTVWADPYTGAIRLTYASRSFADLPQSAMGLLYGLHYSLLLGPWGEWAFGVAALIWTVDCFVGFYLTLPTRSRTAATAGGVGHWWRRWQPAWTVRRRARGFKLHFDLHRAGGLWLWPLLLVFAWSGVALNLPAVHRPVMHAMGARFAFEPPALAEPMTAPPVPLATARALGRDLMAAEAGRLGITIEKEGYILFDQASGLYQYAVRTSLDPSTSEAGTVIWFDAAAKRIRGRDLPRGQTTADSLITWYELMHRARIYGLPYRIAVSALGLLVVALSVTGVILWSRKRTARLLRAGPARSRSG